MSKYLTFPVTLIPFIEHNDPTRCQMSASQMKQTLILENPDIPLICTGYENVKNLNIHILVAPDNGEVIYINNNVLIVKYETMGYQYYRLGWYYNIYVSQGSIFKSGDILFEHKSLRNGTLTYGKNMLVAYMEYFGYCHEDAIVMSESAAKKFESIESDVIEIEISPKDVLLSLSKSPNVYQPLPKKGQLIKAQEPILLIKTLLTGNSRKLFNEPEKVTLDYDIKVENIEVFINNWCRENSDYHKYIMTLLEDSKKSYKQLLTLKEHLSMDDINDIAHICNVNIHNKHGRYDFDGILIKIHYTYKKKVQLGDKFANRHANKGVISKIVPDEEMPLTPWGERVEVIFGFLSIISRMNLGQLYELHASLALKNFKDMLLEKYESNPKGTIEYMINVLSNIASDNSWYIKMLKETYEKYGPDKRLITDLVWIQPPYTKFTIHDLKKFMKISNTQMSYNLMLKGKTVSNVAVGYSYVLRLVHTAEKKLAMRSVGKYATKNLQPLKGSGAQRVGEMEVWAFMAYNAIHNLKDINIKSDDMFSKIEVLKHLYDKRYTVTTKENQTASFSLLRNYFNAIGLDIN